MIDSLRLQMDVQGVGSPLLLVPGGLTGWKSWEPFVDSFAVNHQVIRVQLINVQYGLEGRMLPNSYSVGTEVDALARTLQTLPDADPFDIIAWSYGAEAALSYAIHHPARVRSLTLIEPPAFWLLKGQDSDTRELMEDREFQRTLAVDSITEEQLIAFSHYAGLVPDDTDPRTLPPWPVWMEHRQSLRFGDAPFRHNDDTALLRAFDKPVLLVKGKGSKPYYHQIIDLLETLLPDARAIMLDGAHAPHIIAKDEFLAQLTGFFEDRVR